MGCIFWPQSPTDKRPSMLAQLTEIILNTYHGFLKKNAYILKRQC